MLEMEKLRSGVESWFSKRWEQVAGGARDSGGGMQIISRKGSGGNVSKMNNELLDRMFTVADGDGWEEIKSSDKIVVWRKRLPSGLSFGGGDAARAEKFFVVKAKATINAPADKLFNLFVDNSRVPEYNEHCLKLKDLEVIDSDTKVSWSATGRFGGGVFKARDFVTRVHYRKMSNGSYVVVNRPEVHKDAQPTRRYVRAEVLLAGNVMRPRKDNPQQTDFMVITHVNPGGIADTALGSKIINLLCANSPFTFIHALEKAANRR